MLQRTLLGVAFFWAAGAHGAPLPEFQRAYSIDRKLVVAPAGVATPAGAAAPIRAEATSLPLRLEELLFRPEIARPAPPPVPRTAPVAAPSYDNLWERIRAGFAMPELRSPLVTRWEDWYVARPLIVKGILDRSRRYLFHVAEEIGKRGLPTELALLPMVESGYDPRALSPAQAAGLWQFIPATARDYNLPQREDYDARHDIIASTTAALDYLHALHQMFGDWKLALASYNWGEKAVARAIERNAARSLETDYASLTLPEETRNYVPKLQALKNIVAEPDRFGIALEPIPDTPYFTTVASDRALEPAAAARLAGIPLDEFVALNPAHRHAAPASGERAQIVLPVHRAGDFEQKLRAVRP